MKVKAKLNNLRIAPRKVRLVIDLIRGLDVEIAKHQLRFLPKKSAGVVLKLLNSAIANATHNFKLDPENLYIAEVFAGEGVVLKRIMPRAMGRAANIRKRTSNITLILAEKNKQMDEKEEEEQMGKKKILTETKIAKEKLSKIEKTQSVEDGKNVPEAKKKTIKKELSKSSEMKAHRGVKRIAGIAKRTFKDHNHK